MKKADEVVLQSFAFVVGLTAGLVALAVAFVLEAAVPLFVLPFLVAVTAYLSPDVPDVTVENFLALSAGFTALGVFIKFVAGRIRAN